MGSSQHAVAAEEEYLSDRARRRRRLDDPEVKARIAEIKAENEAPDSAERSGISAEELPDFLREQRRRR
jgi:alkylation response protein AidB-like acyl-CoA dehydrogenase